MTTLWIKTIFEVNSVFYLRYYRVILLERLRSSRWTFRRSHLSRSGFESDVFKIRARSVTAQKSNLKEKTLLNMHFQSIKNKCRLLELLAFCQHETGFHIFWNKIMGTSVSPECFEDKYSILHFNINLILTLKNCYLEFSRKSYKQYVT